MYGYIWIKIFSLLYCYSHHGLILLKWINFNSSMDE